MSTDIDSFLLAESEHIATMFAWKHGLSDVVRAELEAWIKEAVQLREMWRHNATSATLEEEFGPRDRLFARCESPLERLFLCFLEYHSSARVDVSTDTPGLLIAHQRLWIVPQLEIETYRVDLAVRRIGHGTLDPLLVVELDGHDFHERTKEQAQRDKSRDRRLQALGWRVLRFTGSEVYRDPSACVSEVLALLYAAGKESA